MLVSTAQLLVAVLSLHCAAAGLPLVTPDPAVHCAHLFTDSMSPRERLRQALIQFDVFGSVPAEVNHLVKFLENVSGAETGHRAMQSSVGAAPAWFDHIYIKYLNRKAPPALVLKLDAQLITTPARHRVRTAYATVLADLREALVHHSGPLVEQGIYELDVYAPNVPERERLIEYLGPELTRATNHAPDQSGAAAAWFDYLYRVSLNQAAPDFHFAAEDLIANNPNARRRVRNAWFNFILDLREALGRLPPAHDPVPTPSIQRRKILARVTKPGVGPSADAVAPAVELSVAPLVEPVAPAVLEKASPKADQRLGASPGQDAIDTILTLNEARARVLFFRRYQKTLRPTQPGALDAYLDLAFAEFAPGFKRTPRAFAKAAARDVEHAKADPATLATFVAAWRELRGEVARRETMKSLRVETQPIEFISGFREFDPLGGRSSITYVDDRADGLMLREVAHLWLAFFAKYNRIANITSQNGLQHTALSALLMLKAHVPDTVYREARNLVLRRGNHGLLENDYQQVRANRPKAVARFAKIVRILQWTMKSAELDQPLTRESARRTIAEFERLTALKL